MSSPSTGSRSFSIVLVIKKNTHDNVADNFERFVTIGMVTYEKYLNVAAVKDFIIVTTQEEQRELSDMLTAKWPTWPWKFVSEDKLLNKSIRAGWARQQTAKLAVSMLITTDHYLIIDDDTYLTRPFGYADLFDDDGKVIMNKTLIDFPFFFLWSNQVLKYDFDKVQSQEYHMAITPEIFITQEVRGLVRFLVTMYGDSKQWQRFLADHKYTEYCIYWIWLIQQDKHKTLYSGGGKSLYGHETTNPAQDLRKNVAASFDPTGAHYFSFVQTSIGHPLATIRDLVHNLGMCKD